MSIFYKTVSDYPNATGAMPALFAIRDNIPYSFDAVLMVIFLVLAFGQYFILKNRTGRSKMLTALLSSSIFLTTLSLLLALSDLVTFIEPVFYAFLAIVFYSLYHLSDNW